ncbi:MAG: hypothetical protein ACOVOI_20550, partial [Hyphomicrobiales bacterium]
RALVQVIRRQVRWSACRRTEEPLLFIAEPLVGGLAAMIAAGLAAPLIGLASILAVLATALIWITVEIALARSLGWPTGLALAPAILCREALSPLIWLGALTTPGAPSTRPQGRRCWLVCAGESTRPPARLVKPFSVACLRAQ